MIKEGIGVLIARYNLRTDYSARFSLIECNRGFIYKLTTIIIRDELSMLSKVKRLNSIGFGADLNELLALVRLFAYNLHRYI